MDRLYRENISGIDIAFYSDESEEYTARLVNLLKARVRQTLDANKTLAPPRAAMLTCLELCDDIEKMKKSLAEVEELKKRLNEITALQNETEQHALSLESEVLDLRLELSNLK